MGFASFLYRQLFAHPPPLPPNLSLEGLTIIVTGSNSGIGLEAARQCVRMNAHLVILAVRTVSKGEAAKKEIQASNPTSKTLIEVWQLDMEDFESVLQFGKRAQALQRLDISILNAGVMKFEWSVQKDGIESDLMVNHIATALLTLLLLPVQQRTARETGRVSRLTCTNSEMHMWTPFKERTGTGKILDRLSDEKFFGGDTWDRYSVTKLLNVFWMEELAGKINSDEVVLNFLNPGLVDTGLHRDSGKVVRIMDWLLAWTPQEGGRLLIDAAVVKGKESHGKYLSEAKIVP